MDSDRDEQVSGTEVDCSKEQANKELADEQPLAPRKGDTRTGPAIGWQAIAIVALITASVEKSGQRTLSICSKTRSLFVPISHKTARSCSPHQILSIRTICHQRSQLLFVCAKME